MAKRVRPWSLFCPDCDTWLSGMTGTTLVLDDCCELAAQCPECGKLIAMRVEDD